LGDIYGISRQANNYEFFISSSIGEIWTLLLNSSTK
jgi:hypothetical protein